MSKEDVEYIHNGILLSHNINEILLFGTTWMVLEDIRLSDLNQTERDTYHDFT